MVYVGVLGDACVTGVAGLVGVYCDVGFRDSDPPGDETVIDVLSRELVFVGRDAPGPAVMVDLMETVG